MSAEEQAFAIAHELAHLVCHPGLWDTHFDTLDATTLPVTVAIGEGRVWGYSPQQTCEIEANIFAAELLAPGADMRTRFLAGETYATLARRYAITETTALNQLLSIVLGGGMAHTQPSRHADSDPEPDKSQQRAAQADDLRVLVEAGPGTGKTRTLIARIVHLIQQHGIAPHHMVVLTFSNQAAEELRERLRRCGVDVSGVTIATFHGFALDTLRRFASEAGLPSTFGIIDDLDARILLEGELPKLDLHHYLHLARPSLYLSSLLSASSRMRDEMRALDEITLPSDTDGDADEESARVRETMQLLRTYESLLQTTGVLDYGDLIARAIRLLRDRGDVAATLRRQYRYVLVDEYQDVNRASAMFLRELVDEQTSLWVVGDVRQAIYAFRGAARENLDAFDRDFGETTRLSLDVNYRSVPAIVTPLATYARAIGNQEIVWKAERQDCPDGGVTLVRATNGENEIAGIIDDIRQSIARGRKPSDHAILCSLHRQAAAIAGALERAGYPTTYLGDFFLRREIKDMLAFLELCCGFDGAALLRLATWPEYRLEPEEQRALLRAAKEQHAWMPAALHNTIVAECVASERRPALERLTKHLDAVRFLPDPASVLLHYLFGEAAYLRTLLREETVAGKQAAATLFQLVVLARSYVMRPLTVQGSTLSRDFLRYVRWLLDSDERMVVQATASIPGAVNVLTVHASKGLEFPVVYVPNLVVGSFPPNRRGGAKVALPPDLASLVDFTDDGRNLLFVAMSRAQERLILSRARVYGRNGSRELDLITQLGRIRSVTCVDWHPASPAASAAPLQVPVASAIANLTISHQDLTALIRCPQQYMYEIRLGLRGVDDGKGYKAFHRLLRVGLREIQAWHGTPIWPERWADAEMVLRAGWTEKWPTGYSLEAFYRRAAFRAYERAFHELDQGGPPSVRRVGELHPITIDGATVIVEIDEISQRGGVTLFIWERATAIQRDEQDVMIALYVAVVSSANEIENAAVAIRYLDTGSIRMIPNALAVADAYRQPIRIALHRLNDGHFPPEPRDPTECRRCPFMCVCPRGTFT